MTEEIKRLVVGVLCAAVIAVATMLLAPWVQAAAYNYALAAGTNAPGVYSWLVVVLFVLGGLVGAFVGFTLAMVQGNTWRRN